MTFSNPSVHCEAIIADYIGRYLSKYLEGVNTHTFQLALWSGVVELNRLKVRKEVLDSLTLPVTVLFGYVGKVRVEIPWLSLLNQPIVLTLEDVLVICGPSHNDQWDEEAELRRQKAKKDEQVKEAEIYLQSIEDAIKEGILDSTDDYLSSGASNSLVDSQSNIKPSIHGSNEAKDSSPLHTIYQSAEGRLEYLIGKIVKNLQVNINRIHIRYEDSCQLPPQLIGPDIQLPPNPVYSGNSCAAAGLTLNAITLKNQDEDDLNEPSEPHVPPSEAWLNSIMKSIVPSIFHIINKARNQPDSSSTLSSDRLYQFPFNTEVPLSLNYQLTEQNAIQLLESSPVFPQLSSVFKLVQVKRLGIYFNVDDFMFVKPSFIKDDTLDTSQEKPQHQEMGHEDIEIQSSSSNDEGDSSNTNSSTPYHHNTIIRMLEMITGGDDVSFEGVKGPLQYILQPWSFDIRLQIRHGVTRISKSIYPSPNLVFQVSVKSPVQIQIDQMQLSRIGTISSNLGGLAVRKKFRRYRPSVPPSNNARAWWVFLKMSLFARRSLHVSPKDDPQNVWDWLDKRRNQRLSYIALWKAIILNRVYGNQSNQICNYFANISSSIAAGKQSSSSVSTFSSSQPFDTIFSSKKLDSLEKHLDSNDIIFFRAMAVAELQSHGVVFTSSMQAMALDQAFKQYSSSSKAASSSYDSPQQQHGGFFSKIKDWVSGSPSKVNSGVVPFSSLNVNQLVDTSLLCRHLERFKPSLKEEFQEELECLVGLRRAVQSAQPSIVLNSSEYQRWTQKIDPKLALVDPQYTRIAGSVMMAGVQVSLMHFGTPSSKQSSPPSPMATALSSSLNPSSSENQIFTVSSNEVTRSNSRVAIGRFEVGGIGVAVAVKPKFNTIAIKTSVRSIYLLNLMELPEPTLAAVQKMFGIDALSNPDQFPFRHIIFPSSHSFIEKTSEKSHLIDAYVEIKPFSDLDGSRISFDTSVRLRMHQLSVYPNLPFFNAVGSLFAQPSHNSFKSVYKAVSTLDKLIKVNQLGGLNAFYRHRHAHQHHHNDFLDSFTQSNQHSSSSDAAASNSSHASTAPKGQFLVTSSPPKAIQLDIGIRLPKVIVCPSQLALPFLIPRNGYFVKPSLPPPLPETSNSHLLLELGFLEIRSSIHFPSLPLIASYASMAIEIPDIPAPSKPSNPLLTSSSSSSYVASVDSITHSLDPMLSTATSIAEARKIISNLIGPNTPLHTVSHWINTIQVQWIELSINFVEASSATLHRNLAPASAFEKFLYFDGKATVNAVIDSRPTFANPQARVSSNPITESSLAKHKKGPVKLQATKLKVLVELPPILIPISFALTAKLLLLVNLLASNLNVSSNPIAPSDTDKSTAQNLQLDKLSPSSDNTSKSSKPSSSSKPTSGLLNLPPFFQARVSFGGIYFFIVSSKPVTNSSNLLSTADWMQYSYRGSDRSSPVTVLLSAQISNIRVRLANADLSLNSSLVASVGGFHVNLHNVSVGNIAKHLLGGKGPKMFSHKLIGLGTSFMDLSTTVIPSQEEINFNFDYSPFRKLEGNGRPALIASVQADNKDLQHPTVSVNASLDHVMIAVSPQSVHFLLHELIKPIKDIVSASLPQLGPKKVSLKKSQLQSVSDMHEPSRSIENDEQSISIDLAEEELDTTLSEKLSSVPKIHLTVRSESINLLICTSKTNFVDLQITPSPTILITLARTLADIHLQGSHKSISASVQSIFIQQAFIAANSLPYIASNQNRDVFNDNIQKLRAMTPYTICYIAKTRSSSSHAKTTKQPPILRMELMSRAVYDSIHGHMIKHGNNNTIEDEWLLQVNAKLERLSLTLPLSLVPQLLIPIANNFASAVTTAIPSPSPQTSATSSQSEGNHNVSTATKSPPSLFTMFLVPKISLNIDFPEIIIPFGSGEDTTLSHELHHPQVSPSAATSPTPKVNSKLQEEQSAWKTRIGQSMHREALILQLGTLKIANSYIIHAPSSPDRSLPNQDDQTGLHLETKTLIELNALISWDKLWFGFAGWTPTHSQTHASESSPSPSSSTPTFTSSIHDRISFISPVFSEQKKGIGTILESNSPTVIKVALNRLFNDPNQQITHVLLNNSEQKLKRMIAMENTGDWRTKFYSQFTSAPSALLPIPPVSSASSPSNSMFMLDESVQDNAPLLDVVVDISNISIQISDMTLVYASPLTQMVPFLLSCASFMKISTDSEVSPNTDQAESVLQKSSKSEVVQSKPPPFVRVKFILNSLSVQLYQSVLTSSLMKHELTELRLRKRAVVYLSHVNVAFALFATHSYHPFIVSTKTHSISASFSNLSILTAADSCFVSNCSDHHHRHHEHHHSQNESVASSSLHIPGNIVGWTPTEISSVVIPQAMIMIVGPLANQFKPEICHYDPSYASLVSSSNPDHQMAAQKDDMDSMNFDLPNISRPIFSANVILSTPINLISKQDPILSHIPTSAPERMRSLNIQDVNLASPSNFVDQSIEDDLNPDYSEDPDLATPDEIKRVRNGPSTSVAIELEEMRFVAHVDALASLGNYVTSELLPLVERLQTNVKPIENEDSEIGNLTPMSSERSAPQRSATPPITDKSFSSSSNQNYEMNSIQIVAKLAGFSVQVPALRLSNFTSSKPASFIPGISLPLHIVPSLVIETSVTVNLVKTEENVKSNYGAVDSSNMEPKLTVVAALNSLGISRVPYGSLMIRQPSVQLAKPVTPFPGMNHESSPTIPSMRKPPFRSKTPADLSSEPRFFSSDPFQDSIFGQFSSYPTHQSSGSTSPFPVETTDRTSRAVTLLEPTNVRVTFHKKAEGEEDNEGTSQLASKKKVKRSSTQSFSGAFITATIDKIGLNVSNHDISIMVAMAYTLLTSPLLALGGSKNKQRAVLGKSIPPSTSGSISTDSKAKTRFPSKSFISVQVEAGGLQLTLLDEKNLNSSMSFSAPTPFVQVSLKKISSSVKLNKESKYPLDSLDEAESLTHSSNMSIDAALELGIDYYDEHGSFFESILDPSTLIASVKIEEDEQNSSSKKISISAPQLFSLSFTNQFALNLQQKLASWPIHEWKRCFSIIESVAAKGPRKIHHSGDAVPIQLSSMATQAGNTSYGWRSASSILKSCMLQHQKDTAILLYNLGKAADGTSDSEAARQLIMGIVEELNLPMDDSMSSSASISSKASNISNISSKSESSNFSLHSRFGKSSNASAQSSWGSEKYPSSAIIDWQGGVQKHQSVLVNMTGFSVSYTHMTMSELSSIALGSINSVNQFASSSSSMQLGTSIGQVQQSLSSTSVPASNQQLPKQPSLQQTQGNSSSITPLLVQAMQVLPRDSQVPIMFSVDQDAHDRHSKKIMIQFGAYSIVQDIPLNPADLDRGNGTRYCEMSLASNPNTKHILVIEYSTNEQTRFITLRGTAEIANDCYSRGVRVGHEGLEKYSEHYKIPPQSKWAIPFHWLADGILYDLLLSHHKIHSPTLIPGHDLDLHVSGDASSSTASPNSKKANIMLPPSLKLVKRFALDHLYVDSVESFEYESLENLISESPLESPPYAVYIRFQTNERERLHFNTTTNQSLEELPKPINMMDPFVPSTVPSLWSIYESDGILIPEQAPREYEYEQDGELSLLSAKMANQGVDRLTDPSSPFFAFGSLSIPLTIHIRPTLTLINLLCCPMDIQVFSEGNLIGQQEDFEAGTRFEVFFDLIHSKEISIRIRLYSKCSWSSQYVISSPRIRSLAKKGKSSFNVASPVSRVARRVPIYDESFNSQGNEQQRRMTFVELDYSRPHRRCLDVTLFSTHNFVNQTGLPLNWAVVTSDQSSENNQASSSTKYSLLCGQSQMRHFGGFTNMQSMDDLDSSDAIYHKLIGSAKSIDKVSPIFASLIPIESKKKKKKSRNHTSMLSPQLLSPYDSSHVYLSGSGAEDSIDSSNNHKNAVISEKVEMALQWWNPNYPSADDPTNNHWSNPFDVTLKSRNRVGMIGKTASAWKSSSVLTPKISKLTSFVALPFLSEEMDLSSPPSYIHLVVEVQRGSGVMWRTTTVTVSPRFFISNHCPSPIIALAIPTLMSIPSTELPDTSNLFCMPNDSVLLVDQERLPIPHDSSSSPPLLSSSPPENPTARNDININNFESVCMEHHRRVLVCTQSTPLFVLPCSHPDSVYDAVKLSIMLGMDSNQPLQHRVSFKLAELGNRTLKIHKFDGTSSGFIRVETSRLDSSATLIAFATCSAYLEQPAFQELEQNSLIFANNGDSRLSPLKISTLSSPHLFKNNDKMFGMPNLAELVSHMIYNYTETWIKVVESDLASTTQKQTRKDIDFNLLKNTITNASLSSATVLIEDNRSILDGQAIGTSSAASTTVIPPRSCMWFSWNELEGPHTVDIYVANPPSTDFQLGSSFDVETLHWKLASSSSTPVSLDKVDLKSVAFNFSALSSSVSAFSMKQTTPNEIPVLIQVLPTQNSQPPEQQTSDGYGQCSNVRVVNILDIRAVKEVTIDEIENGIPTESNAAQSSPTNDSTEPGRKGRETKSDCLDVSVSLGGIDFSILDVKRCQEMMYMSISGISVNIQKGILSKGSHNIIGDMVVRLAVDAIQMESPPPIPFSSLLYRSSSSSGVSNIHPSYFLMSSSYSSSRGKKIDQSGTPSSKNLYQVILTTVVDDVPDSNTGVSSDSNSYNVSSLPTTANSALLLEVVVPSSSKTSTKSSSSIQTRNPTTDKKLIKIKSVSFQLRPITLNINQRWLERILNFASSCVLDSKSTSRAMASSLIIPSLGICSTSTSPSLSYSSPSKLKVAKASDSKHGKSEVSSFVSSSSASPKSHHLLAIAPFLSPRTPLLPAPSSKLQTFASNDVSKVYSSGLVPTLMIDNLLIGQICLRLSVSTSSFLVGGEADSLIGEEDLYSSHSIDIHSLESFAAAYQNSSQNVNSSGLSGNGNQSSNYSMGESGSTISSKLDESKQMDLIHHYRIFLSLSSSQPPIFDASSIPLFVRMIVVGFGGIEGLKLRFSSAMLPNILMTPKELGRQIVLKHYAPRAALQLIKVAGSLNAFGNWWILAENLGEGMKDVALDPFTAQGGSILSGALNGLSSLVIKSVFALSTTTSNFAGSWGKVLSEIINNNSYKKNSDRRNQVIVCGDDDGGKSNNKNSSSAWLSTSPDDFQMESNSNNFESPFLSAYSTESIVADGVENVGYSVIDSVVSLFERPATGWRTQGTLGAFSGFATGIAELALRPAVAILNAVQIGADHYRHSAARSHPSLWRPQRIPVSKFEAHPIAKIHSEIINLTPCQYDYQSYLVELTAHDVLSTTTGLTTNQPHSTSRKSFSATAASAAIAAAISASSSSSSNNTKHLHSSFSSKIAAKSNTIDSSPYFIQSELFKILTLNSVGSYSSNLKWGPYDARQSMGHCLLSRIAKEVWNTSDSTFLGRYVYHWVISPQNFSRSNNLLESFIYILTHKAFFKLAMPTSSVPFDARPSRIFQIGLSVDIKLDIRWSISLHDISSFEVEGTSHSVEYALGILGTTKKIPRPSMSQVVSSTTNLNLTSNKLILNLKNSTQARPTKDASNRRVLKFLDWDTADEVMTYIQMILDEQTLSK